MTSVGTTHDTLFIINVEMLNEVRGSHGLFNAQSQHLPAVTEKPKEQLSDDSQFQDRNSELELIHKLLLIAKLLLIFL
jgi:hypothetical protein